MLNVLDLFCGLWGFSQAFIDRGHNVFGVDWDSSFSPHLCIDISKLTVSQLPWRRGEVHVIVASPPCDCFSRAVRNVHFRDEEPLTIRGAKAVRLVERTLQLIQYYQPQLWLIENPVGKLNTLPVLQDVERRPTTMCQYGRPYQKPTSVWSNWPDEFDVRPPCKPGDPCHEPAPRGSWQGLHKYHHTAAERAKIPYALSLDACVAAEKLAS